MDGETTDTDRTEPDRDVPAIPLTRAGVEGAHRRLRDHLFETPLLPAPYLSNVTGAEIRLKAENIQRGGSFKVRGSVNKLRKLVESGGVERVTAASAGNHAQGVAYAAGLLGVKATIFMPRDAPVAKKRATQLLGARVRVEGQNYDEARAACLRYAERESASFIDGFDDWDIIEGQATIGVELARALGEHKPDYVLVPAGGGGLLAGILFYIREFYGDEVTVLGVQSERAPALAESLRQDRAAPGSGHLPLEVETRATIADGIRIGRPGDRPWAVIRRWVDDVVLVEEEAIYAAIVNLYEHSRLVVEGAGAVGVAALLQKAVEPPEGARVVVIVSGGNVDAGAMQKIITSYLFKSGRRVVFRIRVKDLPGQLARVVGVFERERLNIAEIEQPPILAKPVSPEYTVFDICVETEGRGQFPKIVQALEEERERMRAEGQEPFEILRR